VEGRLMKNILTWVVYIECVLIIPTAIVALVGFFPAALVAMAALQVYLIIPDEPCGSPKS
jgi:hypothetical protein